MCFVPSDSKEGRILGWNNISKKHKQKKPIGGVRKKGSQSSPEVTMMPIYSSMPLQVFIYTCIYSYVRCSKLSQGERWGKVKLDLKQIGMKERKEKTRCTHKREHRVWGGEHERSEGWRQRAQWQGTKGIRCLLLLWEFSHSLEKFSEQAGVGSGNQKLPNVW